MAGSSEAAATLVQEATDAVRADLTRSDARASTLLPLFGAVLAVVVVVTRAGLTPAAAIFVRASAAPAALAALLLLWVVRSPVGGSTAGLDIRRYATFIERPGELADEFAGLHPDIVRVQRLTRLSAIASKREQHIRYAVDLFLLSLALLMIASIVIMSAPV